jgi:hypothetical protein
MVCGSPPPIACRHEPEHETAVISSPGRPLVRGLPDGGELRRDVCAAAADPEAHVLPHLF